MLRFNKEGKFKIVQLTDVHLGYHEHKDADTQKLISDIIRWESPELVVVTGDIISGNKWDKKTPQWSEKQYKKLTSVLTEHKQPWAFTAGNHDCEGDITR